MQWNEEENMAEADSSPVYPGRYADYVKRRLSPALVEGLTKIAEYRPKNPIEFLGHYLRKYRAQCPLEPISNKSLTEFQESHSFEDKKSLGAEVGDDVGSFDVTSITSVHKDCNRTFVCIGDIFDDSDFV